VLHVLICEDNPEHRAQMESIVHRHISTEDCEMELVLSVGSPTDVLDYLALHPDKRGLYFLDVDLQHEINGIELAAKIREIDTTAKIVFVTTRAELAYLTFTHKVEALDYIIKDRPEDIETRAMECMLVAYKRYMNDKKSKQKLFTVKADGELWSVPHDDILFFETSPAARHRMILHMKNGQIEFRGQIGEVAKIGPEFYRCNQSFIVNLNNIKRVDTPNRTIEMVNGELVPITVRKISDILKLLGK